MMKVFVVYCHPSSESLTSQAKDSFLRGLESSGHSYILSDLYAMNFSSDMSEEEYKREAFYRRDLPVLPDVKTEQDKVNSSDAIAFIYPVFWSDAPAKLVGWFNRVWTYGFAYGDEREMKVLEKGIVLCSAGNSLEYFRRTGLGEAMRRVFLDDRLGDRVMHKEQIILEETSREFNLQEANRERHLKRSFQAGADF
ncbi:MAG: NAD(P)H-dependent oxidoreductase [Treponema sp.]|jgi:NAD(P)H dehydrogenase (quinone)|nr:NAD(P)H-dependent oxidoreductase [Treponema sp.]